MADEENRVDLIQRYAEKLAQKDHRSLAERAAERYGVPAYQILKRVGEAGYVGGQEDMIIDVAIELAGSRP